MVFRAPVHRRAATVWRGLAVIHGCRATHCRTLAPDHGRGATHCRKPASRERQPAAWRREGEAGPCLPAPVQRGVAPVHFPDTMRGAQRGGSLKEAPQAFCYVHRMIKNRGNFEKAAAKALLGVEQHGVALGLAYCGAAQAISRRRLVAARHRGWPALVRSEAMAPRRWSQPLAPGVFPISGTGSPVPVVSK